MTDTQVNPTDVSIEMVVAAKRYLMDEIDREEFEREWKRLRDAVSYIKLDDEIAELRENFVEEYSAFVDVLYKYGDWTEVSSEELEKRVHENGDGEYEARGSNNAKEQLLMDFAAVAGVFESWFFASPYDDVKHLAPITVDCVYFLAHNHKLEEEKLGVKSAIEDNLEVLDTIYRAVMKEKQTH